MPSINLLVVGDDKALPDFEEALESCKRYVGPIKLFTAHKAVDAVSRLQKLVQTCGQCHAAFLSNHFTCPGKEEFSETLRKVIKEKHPDVPVICWGNPKKGGELNKHFHATLEFLKNGGGDVNALVDILKQVEAGQIRPEYLHKDQRKSLDRRNSLERTDSIRATTRIDSGVRRVDSKRAPIEGRSPTLDRMMSTRRSIDDDSVSPAASGGLQSNPTLMRRRSMERKGSLESRGTGVTAGLATAIGTGMSGMHLGSTNTSVGSMNTAGVGMPIGVIGLNTMGSMNTGMATFNGAGLGGLNTAGMVSGVVPAMMNAGMMSGMGGMTANSFGVAGMNAAMGMGVGTVMNGASMGMAGAPSTDGTALKRMSVGGTAVAPAAAPQPPTPAANTELIRMLAEEVLRLRKAVEEKRARDAEAAHFRDLQQQHAVLQQQLAAMSGRASGLRSSNAGFGVGVGGGGMPLGI